MAFAFDSTINLGNVITAAGTVVGLMWAYHKWDTKVEIRHQKNIWEFESLNGKVDRIETKVDDAKRDVNGTHQKIAEISSELKRHSLADEIVQREIIRRLEKING
jgi:hypothetical protein